PAEFVDRLLAQVVRLGLLLGRGVLLGGLRVRLFFVVRLAGVEMGFRGQRAVGIRGGQLGEHADRFTAFGGIVLGLVGPGQFVERLIGVRVLVVGFQQFFEAGRGLGEFLQRDLG